MKLLYTHQNPLVVRNLQNLVEREGIAVEVRNEFAGSAVGDLAPISTWLELWVADRDYIRGQAVVDSLNRDDAKPWRCDVCGELNGASFEICWRCHSKEVEVDEA